MFSGQFGLELVPGRETKEGYVALAHNATFAVALINRDFFRRAEATLTVNGEKIGTFRVLAGQRIHIERPLHSDRRFTALKAGTPEFAQAQAERGDFDNGLIQCSFVLEKPRTYAADQWTGAIYRAAGPSTLEGNWTTESLTKGLSGSVSTNVTQGASASGPMHEAAVGLSGHSSQNFTTVMALDVDESTRTEIALRIGIVDEPAVIPLRATPIPPPLK